MNYVAVISAFVIGIALGVIIMAIVQCMRSDELQELIDLSDGHDDA